ncbi:hypothetical protein [Bacillus norwichensis]|uniref:Uncharacterized protein n=1 Tax=Bacillus norwichensis TaxID=2762217 RepID=A0ABR8VRF2_9BACI|nr:hypothetical protein [Bacillus norwichensis]MBD8007351.1 hypothetical protein [Bacillus norwichensis]
MFRIFMKSPYSLHNTLTAYYFHDYQMNISGSHCASHIKLLGLVGATAENYRFLLADTA